ncbi:LPXTG cell wall anchor domain-containing protein [Kitasatospora sp. NPDC002551]|uniref:LPXTG cell wall anchor domain-containing protein n=1 Tax=Kitasatospora sp. NPDC002551 TaxID=3154539 RepID=UPI00332063A9
MSVMPGFAKSSGTSATTRRRRIATVAATVVLAGSVQLLTAESSWACAGDNAKVPASSTTKAAPTAAPEAAPKADAADRSSVSIGFFMTPDLAVKAGGPKVEFGAEIGNHSGAPMRNVVPSLALSAGFAGDAEGGVRYLASKYLTVEYRFTGGWQKLSLRHGCDPTLFAAPAKGVPVATDRVEHVTFRVGLAADAPAGLRTLHAGLAATAENGKRSEWVSRNIAVTVPKPSKPAPDKSATPKPTPTKPAATAPAKPAAAKPTATAPAKPANPAGDRTAAAPTAPATPESKPAAAPATSAPAGTPELAQTGAGTPNGLLAGLAAGLAALGAGLVVAVRRVRAQG